MAEKHTHKGEELLQSKYYEFQMVSEQLQQLQQQQQMLEEQSSEIKLTEEALINLEKSKDKEDLLVPIGQGIFAKAELKDKKSLIINVGSNIMVSKDIAGAKALLQERRQAIDVYRQQTDSSMVELTRRAKLIESELQKIISHNGG